MSKNYNHEIGYESLLADFKRYQKQSPRGVGLTRKDGNIYLQFKIGSTNRKQYSCNCSFTASKYLDKSAQIELYGLSLLVN